MRMSTDTGAGRPDTMNRGWLILTDYASKYRVSISTLRRRIKAGLIEHRLENGRYLLPDEEIPMGGSAEGDLVFEAHELKQAFTSILKEKDDIILKLRAEISDLKTLVQVLESDNDRLRNRARRPESEERTLV